MTETHSSHDKFITDIGAGATNVNVAENINQTNNQTFYQLTPTQPVDATTRAAAQAKLAALPLDVVPPVATLPSGSRLLLSSNPLFVGRDEALKRLARSLKGDASHDFDQVQTAAVTGWGGLGKTQLAVEFAHRYGAYFVGGVFWLNFASADGVPAQVALCGGRGALNLGVDFASLDLDEQVKLVQAAWQNALPCLLIFDNCEEPALLERWRPPTGAARILVTSRRAEWEAALKVQTLPLAVLSRPESVQLLLSLRPDASAAPATLDAIATELGDLPLALHLAGGYLKHYRHLVTPAAYLAELRGPALLQHRSLQEGRHAATLPTHHERNVARTFALSYDRLDAADAIDTLAIRLLARAAYFAPGVVMPRPLVLTSVGIARAPAPGAELDQALQAEDALHRLVELGLLESETGGALRLHRLLARFVQGRSTDDDAQADVEQAIIDLAYDDNESGYPARLLAWQPHLRHVTDSALLRNDQQAATLASNLGYHLKAVGELAAARPYYEQALAIHQTVLGDQHPNTAASLNNLGYLLDAQGELAAARLYYEQALAITRTVFGDQHPTTATILNNLGGLLQAQGELTAARPYYEQALAIRQAVLGDQHPDTASSLNYLGGLLQAQGELTAARPYYEQALAIRQAVLGDQHPDTALSLNSLGYLLCAQGELTAARPYFEQALAIRQAVLGDQHPDTASSLNNLGALLQAQGELVAARPYFEQALAIRQTVLGDQHPDTALSLNNLGGLLQAQGDLTAARPYYEQALAILEKQLGSQHPTTRIVRGNLEGLLAEIEEKGA